MNTKTAIQAIDELVAILERFEQMQREGVFRQIANVQNINFIDFFVLYKRMVKLYGPERIRLYMPGEMETEGMLIVYSPGIGLTVGIESEPCVDFRWKIKQPNFYKQNPN